MESRPLADRRPIRGWEGHYEITRDGQVRSVRTGLWIAYTAAESGAPYLEVSIDGIRQRRSISRAVLEAWGDISQLTATQKRWFDSQEIRLGDYLTGIYRPARQWRRKMQAPTLEERRGERVLVGIVGKIRTEDRIPGYLGDWAVLAQDPGWPAERFPLGYLNALEPALHPVISEAVPARR